MDKERAKFILQGFRPGGEDANEPAFAEALSLAAKDRELGEWLAAERAQDAEFAELLSNVAIPENLREAILVVLEGSSDDPAEFDADFVGALFTVRPPEGLRAQILGAMELERKVTQLPVKARRGGLRTFVRLSSIAAVFAVMLVVTLFFAGAGGNELEGSTSSEVAESAVDMLESPFFSIDLRNDRQAALYEWLEGNNLPTPDQLPEGLKGLKGIGCKVLKIGDRGSRGSLICYRLEDEMVHLVVMERGAVNSEDIDSIKGAVDRCQSFEGDEDWAYTQWADSDHTYCLLSKSSPDALMSLF